MRLQLTWHVRANIFHFPILYAMLVFQNLFVIKYKQQQGALPTRLETRPRVESREKLCSKLSFIVAHMFAQKDNDLMPGSLH